jgi:hypothetical protein
MRKHFPTQHQLDQVRELFEQGFGEKRIAKKLNITRSAVQSVYRALGILVANKLPKRDIKSRSPNQKQCSSCLEIKNTDQFRLHLRQSKFGGNWTSPMCVPCEKIYSKTLNAQPNQKEKRRQYRVENREKLNAYDRGRKQRDPAYRLRTLISTSIYKALKNTNSSKNGVSCLQYLPYSLQELKDHLEKQFETWMTWENQGPCNWNDNDFSTWTWQLDHIIPQSDLPYSSMNDDNFKKCWALENLRPLSAKQNATDGGTKIRHNIILQ